MQRITMNQINPNFTGCIYNLLYIQYNENFGREEFFYYDLAYPVFYNVKNSYFKVDPTILKNLNEPLEMVFMKKWHNIIKPQLKMLFLKESIK